MPKLPFFGGTKMICVDDEQLVSTTNRLGAKDLKTPRCKADLSLLLMGKNDG